MELTTVEVKSNIVDRLGKPVLFGIGLSAFLFLRKKRTCKEDL